LTLFKKIISKQSFVVRVFVKTNNKQEKKK